MTYLQYRGRTYSLLALGCLLPVSLVVGPVALAALESPTQTTVFLVFGLTAAVVLLVIGATQAAATFSITDEHLEVRSVNYVLRIRRSRRLPWSDVRSASMLSMPYMITHTGAKVGGSVITVRVASGPPIRIVGRRDDPGGGELANFHQMIEYMLANRSAAAGQSAPPTASPEDAARAGGGTSPAGCILGLALVLAVVCPLGGAVVWELFRSDPTSSVDQGRSPAASTVARSAPTSPSAPTAPPTVPAGRGFGPSPFALPTTAWDGRSTLICAGPVRMRVADVTVDATFSPAIWTDGSCVLRLDDVVVTAPVVIEARGQSIVTVQGGALTGSVHSIQASGTATVRLEGTRVSGATQVDDGATVEGLER